VLGAPISGLAEASAVDGVQVFCAGVAADPEVPGGLVTSGGRVLAVTGQGPDVATARRRAYEAVDHVVFDGMQVRTDIALSGL
jgi:phosphoribosylamine--glycine ligase